MNKHSDIFVVLFQLKPRRRLAVHTTTPRTPTTSTCPPRPQGSTPHPTQRSARKTSELPRKHPNISHEEDKTLSAYTCMM